MPLQKVKGMQSYKNWYVKGVPFVIIRYMKGGPFLSKMVRVKREIKGAGPRGGASTYKTLLSTPGFFPRK